MSEQHRYEPPAPPRRRNRVLSLVTVLFSVCALCVAVVAGLIVIREQGNSLHRTQDVVHMNQANADHRWCTLFQTILTAPKEPGAPKTPTPAQIRFAKALIRLSSQFDCGKK